MLLGPVASTTLNFKLGLAKTEYLALSILDFTHFEHDFVLAKHGLKLSGVGATGPQWIIERCKVALVFAFNMTRHKRTL